MLNFIVETTCFGLCTGPSSGLDVYQKESYTVCSLNITQPTNALIVYHLF